MKRFKSQMATNRLYRFDLIKVKAVYPSLIADGKLTLLVVDPNQTVESQRNVGEKYIKIFLINADIEDSSGRHCEKRKIEKELRLQKQKDEIEEKIKQRRKKRKFIEIEGQTQIE